MKLIDADALLKHAGIFEVKARARGCGNSILNLAKAWLRNEVNIAPTIDAVPVVRCEKCVHYEMGVCLKIYDDGAASRYAWQERKPDDFCSYGERKEGADNDT